VRLAERRPLQQKRVFSDHSLSSATASLAFSRCLLLFCSFLLSFAFCSLTVQRHGGPYMILRSRGDWEADWRCGAYFWAAEGMRRC